jgi:hypothetical protein
MDFKSLLNKLDSMEAPVKGVAAPELPKAAQLDESAQLRVLAGQSTILAESALMEKAASKAQQQAAGIALAAKKEGKKPEGKGAAAEMSKMSKAELEKIAGTKHKGLPKKVKKEEVEESLEGDLEEGWDDMVQAVNDKKGTGKFDKKEIKPGVTQYTRKSNTFTDGGDDSDTKAAKKKAKKDESVEEGAKPDFLDLNNNGNTKEPMKKAAADKAAGKTGDGKKGMSDKQAKYFGKKDESAMMPKGKKRPVKEGVEGTLTFAKALQIIKESNGTAQIDPLDDQLWAWARRVAATKFDESVKADVYAATTYERMGGTWGIAQINE